MNEPRPEMMPEAPVMTEAPVSGQDAGAAPDVLPSAADLPPGDDDEEELPLPPEDSRPEPGAVTWEGDGDAPASSPAAGTGGGEPPLPPAPSAAAPILPPAPPPGEEKRNTGRVGFAVGAHLCVRPRAATGVPPHGMGDETAGD